MNCDKCGKPAKVHLTQLVGGKIKKFALCDECAAQSGVTDPTGFALADLLFAGAGDQSVAALAPRPPGRGRACPECGFTLDDLKRIRRFGCGACYETFRPEVREMIRGIHKGETHRGKVPEGLMELRQHKLRLEELRGQLDHAVIAENYEAAAGLRDEIRQIEEILTKSESPT